MEFVSCWMALEKKTSHIYLLMIMIMIVHISIYYIISPSTILHILFSIYYKI